MIGSGIQFQLDFIYRLMNGTEMNQSKKHVLENQKRKYTITCHKAVIIAL